MTTLILFFSFGIRLTFWISSWIGLHRDGHREGAVTVTMTVWIIIESWVRAEWLETWPSGSELRVSAASEHCDAGSRKIEENVSAALEHCDAGSREIEENVIEKCLNIDNTCLRIFSILRNHLNREEYLLHLQRATQDRFSKGEAAQKLSVSILNQKSGWHQCHTTMNEGVSECLTWVTIV